MPTDHGKQAAWCPHGILLWISPWIGPLGAPQKQRQQKPGCGGGAQQTQAGQFWRSPGCINRTKKRSTNMTNKVNLIRYILMD